ncbi:AAA family ATPase [Haloferax larsenii]|uniref:Replicative DNA helicase Mcm n=1 Tax=Haloferax larsenii TaxID=302484 RepID=A0A1H7QRC0_HALLR|nr:AAA family ATPase [Haloferax larsenii]SEL50526.1 replicative DNA helicase Mcm [Haloferax larsenii]
MIYITKPITALYDDAQIKNNYTQIDVRKLDKYIATANEPEIKNHRQKIKNGNENTYSQLFKNVGAKVQDSIGIHDIDLAKNIKLTGPTYNSKPIHINQIKSDTVDKHIKIIADVSQASNQYIASRVTENKCISCGQKHSQLQNVCTNDITKPIRCENPDCGKSKFEIKSEYDIDTQKLILSDIASVDSDEDIDAYLQSDDVGTVKIGQRVIVDAIVKKTFNEKTGKGDIYLDITDISVQDEKEQVNITEEDKKRLEDIGNNIPIEQLVQSYAPHIKGRDTEKEAILVSLMGGNGLDGSLSRATINLHFVGEPATGKSETVMWAEQLYNQVQQVDGINVSQAGLTAGIVDNKVDDNESQIVKAGALPRADGGIAIIDELDKMHPEIQNSLFRPLAHNEVKIDKIQSGRIKARANVLATSNPKHGHIDPHTAIADQIDMHEALFSRFDLTFVLKDTTHADKKISKSTLYDETEDGDFVEEEEDVPLSVQEMREYIYYARQINPIVSYEASEKLDKFWTGLRQESLSGNETEEQRQKIDNRNLEALKRITLAYARLQLKERATVEDAERTIWLMEQSLKSLSDGDDMDFTVINKGVTQTQEERKKAILNEVEKAGQMTEWQIAQELGLDYETVKAEIRSMKASGDIIPVSGQITVAN